MQEKIQSAPLETRQAAVHEKGLFSCSTKYSCGLFHFLLKPLNDRLNRSYDKWNANKNQCQNNTERGVCHLHMQNCPIHPFGEYRVVKAMPATAVGRANGKSMRASRMFFPGNEYRVRTHAISTPKPALMSAAAKEVVTVSCSDFSTRASLKTFQIPSAPNEAVQINTIDKGITTIALT